MAVLIFEHRFWEPIVSGDKLHSIRPTRKRPIRPGDPLSLRGWEGKAYRSRQCVLLEETCLRVRQIQIYISEIVIEGYDTIRGPAELDEFARTDGFQDWSEMRDYRNLFYHLPFTGDFIQWGLNRFLESREAWASHSVTGNAHDNMRK